MSHIALVSLVALVLSACSSPLAVINYKQLGACTRATTGSGTIVVPPSHAVVIFRVTSIDNSKTTQNWAFDSTTLQIDPPSAMQQNLGGTGPVPIPAGMLVTLNSLVGIMVETSNPDGSDASTVNYFLLYPLVPPAPGTLGAKENSSQTSYPFAVDCNTIAGG